jgi:hypothetical protein
MCRDRVVMLKLLVNFSLWRSAALLLRRDSPLRLVGLVASSLLVSCRSDDIHIRMYLRFALAGPTLIKRRNI